MKTADYYLKLPYEMTIRPDEEGDWIARIEELEGCIAHGESREEALRRLDEAKEVWIEESLAAGQPIPEPTPEEALPSGKWLQRTPRSLHKNLSRLARIEGTSLNQLVTSILARYVGSLEHRGLTPAQPAANQVLMYIANAMQVSMRMTVNMMASATTTGGQAGESVVTTTGGQAEAYSVIDGTKWALVTRAEKGR